jgi:hypothetical protein
MQSSPSLQPIQLPSRCESCHHERSRDLCHLPFKIKHANTSQVVLEKSRVYLEGQLVKSKSKNKYLPYSLASRIENSDIVVCKEDLEEQGTCTECRRLYVQRSEPMSTKLQLQRENRGEFHFKKNSMGHFSPQILLPLHPFVPVSAAPHLEFNTKLVFK